MKRAVRRLLLHVGHPVDRTFLHYGFRGRGAGRRARTEADVESMDEIAAFYRAHDAAGRIFPEARAPTDVSETSAGRRAPRPAWDVRIPSRWTPLHPSFAALNALEPENARMHVRHFRHERPSPTVVCIHGWGTGYYQLEQRAFRVARLYDAGYDVVLFTLPFHAGRGSGRIRVPPFPSPDPRRTVEGVGQAILDLQELVLWLRARGAESVAVTGMSLGGFMTSLLATATDTVDFIAPMIPVASIPELMWRHGEGGAARAHAHAQGVSEAQFQSAFSSIEVTHRAPRLRGKQVAVFAGERDLVIPMEHPERLAEHFEAETVHTFDGSHLVQVGIGDVFDAFLARMAAAGVTPRAR